MKDIDEDIDSLEEEIGGADSEDVVDAIEELEENLLEEQEEMQEAIMEAESELKES